MIISVSFEYISQNLLITSVSQNLLVISVNCGYIIVTLLNFSSVKSVVCKSVVQSGDCVIL